MSDEAVLRIRLEEGGGATGTAAGGRTTIPGTATPTTGGVPQSFRPAQPLPFNVAGQKFVNIPGVIDPEVAKLRARDEKELAEARKKMAESMGRERDAMGQLVGVAE